MPDTPETEPGSIQNQPGAGQTTFSSSSGLLDVLSRPGALINRFYRCFVGLFVCAIALNIVGGVLPVTSHTEVYNVPEDTAEEYDPTLMIPTSQILSLEKPTVAMNSSGDLFVSGQVTRVDSTREYPGGYVNLQVARDSEIFWEEDIWIPALPGPVKSYPFTLYIPGSVMGESFTEKDLSSFQAFDKFVEVTVDDIPADSMSSDSYEATILEDGVNSQGGIVVYSIHSLDGEWPQANLTPVICFYKEGTLVYSYTVDDLSLETDQYLTQQGETFTFVADMPLPAYDEVRILPLSTW